MRISFPAPTHLNSLFILFLLLPSILTSSSFTIPNDSNSTSNISQIPFYPETQSNTELTLNEPTVDTDITSNPLALDDYMEFLRENNYFGKWTNFDPVNDPIQNYFDNPSGLMVIEALTADISQGGNYFARLPAFRKGLTNFLGSIKDIAPNRAYLDTVRVWSILIKLYDGNYVDQKSANVFYQILDESVIQFYPDNSTISVPDGELEIFIKDEIGDSSFYKHCAANFSLTFQDTRFGQPYRDTAEDSSNVGILFNITSDECNLSISSGLLTMSGFDDPIEIQLYAVISCTIALIEIFGAYKMRNQLRNRRMVFRTALGSVWLIATVDYYMLILHLVLVFAYSLIYIAPFVLYMILAFYLERELILRVLQARSKRDELDISDDSCRSCGFYFAISTGFFVFELVFILMSKLWVVYFNALIFLPQIYHNAKRDKPYNFNFYHIFLTGLIRIGFIAYLKYYPHNIFRLSPDPSFVIIYSSLMVAQVLILLVQTKFPRGFVSLKRKRSRVLTEEDVCPICMGDLKSESTRTDSLLLDFEETIETPCTHVFHVQCLKQWMSNKVECPVCRNMISEVLEEVVSSGSGGENENESEFAGNVEELEIQSVL